MFSRMKKWPKFLLLEHMNYFQLRKHPQVDEEWCQIRNYTIQFDLYIPFFGILQAGKIHLKLCRKDTRK